MAQVEISDGVTELKLPLAIFDSVEVGKLTGKDGTLFTIAAGLDEDRVAQLRERSLDQSDTELRNNTADYKRFGVGDYATWYAKGRTPFVAADPQGKLAAIIWFGPDQPPALTNDFAYPEKNWDTIAFRSYAPYRGVGIMTPMSMFVVDMHKRLALGRTLWLETNQDNESGKHLFHKLGFVDAGTSARNARLVMVHGS